MPTVRLSSNVIQKAVSGGGQDFQVPTRWLQSLYGSGWPIQPVSPPQDSKLPRTIDYPISVNTTLTPRAGFGHMAFSALNTAYENVAEVKNPVSLIHRELTSFTAHLVDADNNEVPDHPFQWLCEKPDGYTPFGVWLTRMVKTTKVYDAAAFYFEEAQGKTTAIHYIDGSTLFILVDEFGNVPKAESINDYIQRYQNMNKTSSTPRSISDLSTAGKTESPKTIQEFINRILARVRDGGEIPSAIPAYTQVIKGTPFAWWSADQIWYQPQSPRTNSPYGDSFIEDAFFWIMLVVNLIAFELGHYKTGNMPEGFATLPRDLFSDTASILVFEQLYNSRMGSNPETERNRLRFFPDGTKWTQTKKADFPDKLYNMAWKVILHSIGIPPSEFGDIPGGGLGGKGFKEGAASDLSRNTLNPHRDYFSGMFNAVLKRNGVDDVTFALDYPMEEIDPDKQKQSVFDGMAHGTLSLNDALGELNLNPVPGSMQTVQDRDGNEIQVPDKDHIANKHLIVAGTAIYVVEDMQSQNGMAVPTFTGKPGGNTGGTPAGPETAVQQSGGSHTPEDNKTIQKVLRNVFGGENLDGKFFSLPARVQKAKPNPKPETPMTPVNQPTKPEGIADPFLEAQPIVSQLVEPYDGITTAHAMIDDRPNHEVEDMGSNPQPFVLDERLDHISVPLGQELNMPQAGAEVHKADATHTDGSMLAVMIPDSVAAQLRAIAEKVQWPSGATLETPENMHVTLAMLPDSSAQGQASQIAEATRTACAAYSLADGRIQGYGVFNGQDGTNVLFALLDSVDLPFLRSAVCQALDKAGIAYAKDYGFVPHVTLAYFPSDFPIPAGFSVPDIACPIDACCLCFGQDRTAIPLKPATTGKFDKLSNILGLIKHCGVCEEDDEYFGAPISRELPIDWPDGNHANGVEIIAMCPPDLPMKPALWKPEGGEDPSLQDWVGGQMYPREEAAYLLDRCLGFDLVPVAYVAEADSEVGAVIYYTAAAGQGLDPAQYDPDWCMKAAIFDYITTELDRGSVGHNVMTHPDDPTRPILIDNGLSFPAAQDVVLNSQFVNYLNGQPIPDVLLDAIQHCLYDQATWRDILTLVGPDAVNKARACAQELLYQKAIVAPVREGT